MLLCVRGGSLWRKFLSMSRPALSDGVKMEVQAYPTRFIGHTGVVCGNGAAHAACDFDRRDDVFVRESVREAT